MKKIIILLVMVLLSVRMYSQQVPIFTVSPSEIDALTENVSIVFDVTGTTVEGVTDIYIWAWCPQLSPSECLLDYDQGSASWGSISSNAILKPIDGQPNKRILQLPLTVTRAGVEVTFRNVAELFGVAETPGKIKEFGFLLRSQDGSKQTPGDLKTKVTLLPLEFSEAFIRTFPAKVSNSDIVTVYMNLNKQKEAGEEERLLVASNLKAQITLKNSSGATLAEAANLVMVAERTGEYAITFAPAFLAQFAEGTSISDVVQFSVTFTGELNGAAGAIEVSSKVYDIDFQIYE